MTSLIKAKLDLGFVPKDRAPIVVVADGALIKHRRCGIVATHRALVTSFQECKTAPIIAIAIDVHLYMAADTLILAGGFDPLGKIHERLLLRYKGEGQAGTVSCLHEETQEAVVIVLEVVVMSIANEVMLVRLRIVTMRFSMAAF